MSTLKVGDIVTVTPCFDTLLGHSQLTTNFSGDAVSDSQTGTQLWRRDHIPLVGVQLRVTKVTKIRGKIEVTRVDGRRNITPNWPFKSVFMSPNVLDLLLAIQQPWADMSVDKGSV